MQFYSKIFSDANENHTKSTASTKENSLAKFEEKLSQLDIVENSKEYCSKDSTPENVATNQLDSREKYDLLLLQLSTANGQFVDALEQNAQLRCDLKFAQQCIHREIGQNVSVASLLADQSSSWRGRAEQIAVLQQQIVDLREQLELKAKACLDRSTHKTDSRIKLDHDKMAKELCAAKTTVDEQTAKLNALRVRNKILAAEIAKQKEGSLRVEEDKQLHAAELKVVQVISNSCCSGCV